MRSALWSAVSTHTTKHHSAKNAPIKTIKLFDLTAKKAKLQLAYTVKDVKKRKSGFF